MQSGNIPTLRALILNQDDDIANRLAQILNRIECDYDMVSDLSGRELDSLAVIFIAGEDRQKLLDSCEEIFASNASQGPVVALVFEHADGAYDDFLKIGIDDIIVYGEGQDYCAARVQLIVDRAAARSMRWVAEDALMRSTALASAVLETTVDGIVTIDDRGKIESVNSAVLKIFGYDPAELIGRNVNILMPDPVRAEHSGYIQNYLDTGHRKIIGIGREVVGCRKDGSLFPLDLAVSEVQVGSRKVFTGILRDISNRRSLEQEILRISEVERARIGQDLHDGLGQMLTGIGLITQNLAKSIREKDKDLSDEIAEVSDLVKEADQQARTLARILTPVDLESAGLDSALSRLSYNAGKLFGVACRYESSGVVDLDNNTVATHLFRITQEAISNAVAHGQADAVRVELSIGKKTLRLRIIDNGTGFKAKENTSATRGMGVHIMNYRAKMIGGSLEIGPAFTGGTAVTCTVRLDMLPTNMDVN